MNAGSMIRSAWELVPILFLLIVGSVIAIRSGVPVAASRQGLRVAMGNVSQVFLRILGYGAVMLVVHEYIGMRATLGW